MRKNTSIRLGDHFESYVASQVTTGRFGSRSEVIREALRKALIEGEESGPYRPFDIEEIIASARQKADLDA